MADINKENIKLLQSQRLDDTDQGGGQMIKYEVVDGEVNNLFPDISRIGRVYGNVSMRKVFLAVQTYARETYYGSHTILTQQAGDPNVSVCFFSTEDWFDTRQDAQNRIESYLVKGPNANIKFWGNHYKGSSLLKCVTQVGWPVPEIGDVLVLRASGADNAEQYVRIIDVSTSAEEFFTSSSSTAYYKSVCDITIGSQLEYDFVGSEVYYGWDQISGDAIFSTVVADASRYHSVSPVLENITAGELQLRVESIFTSLVPSAASETAIVDAAIGSITSPMVQTKDADPSVSRSLSFNISSNAKLYIGEGVKPGTFTWTGGADLFDDETGNIYNGSTIVGSIDYPTGVITFGSTGISATGTGTATYVPACAPQQVSHSGGIQVAINNRGFAYTFNCNPLPMKGTLHIKYLAGGKWYSIWDDGTGKLTNSLDPSIGSGVVNVNTGSVSITLGAMPDVDSQIIFYWAKPAEYYDFSGETLPLRYKFTTNTDGVARNTFALIWTGDGLGPGPAGEYAIVDDGNSNLCVGEYDSGSDNWAPNPTTPVYVGKIRYATGEVDTGVDSSQKTPVANEIFTVQYNYGEPITESFPAPPQSGNSITLNLTNTPIVPGTFKIEWHTLLETYDLETRMKSPLDPTYIFQDDGVGLFEGDTNDGTSGWFQGNLDYNTGEVNFAPHRTDTFPDPVYKWVETAWHLPGVAESYVFDHIEYRSGASLFPVDGTVVCQYCSTDGTNFDQYSGTLTPVFFIKENSALELVIGGLTVNASGTHLVDGRDGKLYFHEDGISGDKIHVGNINYTNKSFTITSDSILLDSMEITSAVGTAAIDPVMSMVFNAPGSPLRPGSVFVKAVTGAGTVLEGTSDFSGNITGTGVFGHVDFNTGLCHVGFGIWVVDDAAAQAEDWYSATATDGAGNVWKPYSVKASSVTMNCVVTSYLPLDPELLGLDPVRLPIDGKVPIFRDGELIVIIESDTEPCPYPLGTDQSSVLDWEGNPCATCNSEGNLPLLCDTKIELESVQGRDLIEVYALPTDYDVSEGDLLSPKLIPDGGEYTVDLGKTPEGEEYNAARRASVTFLAGFPNGTGTGSASDSLYDGEGTERQLIIMHRIEDLCLASDVQVTGHISVTNEITHDYIAGKAQVCSVLPSGNLQSRAYNEFEMETWPGEWYDALPDGLSPPLASYNFIDYPITVINRPSIKERWLILWQTPTTVQIIGENFGVLATNVNIDPDSAATVNGNIEYPTGSGRWFVGVRNRNFAGDDFPFYWLMDLDGFGLGWQSGNCIRFNQDPANFPLWCVRTTLQAPATKTTDYYTLQIRGDSS